ncbi:hypothetical protein J2Z22_001668 [Paenibacillus forsythiae]|uniref:YqzM family protein n=1 Tax=Paenibacillus forsythiae TaxID=365616 RepID=A0ABU3H5R3_9BACL|nr:hypothetical protein [Paenibacillus forsythiae]MDT3426148.1 hypothetical protein [Paenibacillus forsythiae]
MDPYNQDSGVEAEHLERNKTTDSSRIASAFIEYAAYLVIFLGLLYFLVRYLFPKF